MKIQIDTFYKQIQVLDNTSLKELFGFLNERFPDFEWEEWTLTGKDTTSFPWQTMDKIKVPYNPSPFDPLSPTNPFVLGTFTGGAVDSPIVPNQ